MEDEIRPPDQTIRECLIPTNFLNGESEEDQIRRVLEESESEFEFQFAILESKRIEKEREDRIKHFAGFRSKITQFMRIDSQNREFYSELIRYIDKYESGEMLTVNVGIEFYMTFRRTLDNMRLTAEDKTRLLEFIKQDK